MASLEAASRLPARPLRTGPGSGAPRKRAVAAVRAAQHGFWRFERWIFGLKAEATNPKSPLEASAFRRKSAQPL